MLESVEVVDPATAAAAAGGGADAVKPVAAAVGLDAAAKQAEEKNKAVGPADKKDGKAGVKAPEAAKSNPA